MSDSVAVDEDLAPPVEISSIAPLLANAIGRLNRDEPIVELLGGA